MMIVTTGLTRLTRKSGTNFNPEVGFVRRYGFRKPSFGYRYTFTPEGKHLRSIFPHFQWNRWYTIPIAGRPTRPGIRL